MNWSLYPIEEFSRRAAEWARLCAQPGGSHPLHSLDFVEPLIECFADRSVQLAVYGGADRAVAMCLLSRRSLAVWETFSPSQQPLAMLAAGRDADLDAIIRSLADALPSTVCLLGVRCYDARYLARAGATSDQVESLDYGTTMSVDLAGTFEEYWHGRSPKLRNNIGRYFRRLEKEGSGAWRLEEVRAAEAMADKVAAYGLLENAGWKGKEHSAVHPQNAQGRFYSAVLTRFAGRGGARVYNLYFGDRLVASRLAIVEGTTLVFLKTTYDESYSQLAPGRLLLYLALQRIFTDGGIQVVEFYTKASADQLQWSTHSRPIVHLNVFRWAAARSVIRAARRFGWSRPRTAQP